LNVLINLFPLQFPLTAVREFQALKTLRHNNIVKLLDVCCTPSSISNNMIGEVYMVFEYCDADLGGLIVKEKVMHDDYIRCFTHQLLSALVYMHQQGWVHRDIKPPEHPTYEGQHAEAGRFGVSAVNCHLQENDSDGVHFVVSGTRAPSSGS
jgi:cyclin-dependent kinase